MYQSIRFLSEVEGSVEEGENRLSRHIGGGGGKFCIDRQAMDDRSCSFGIGDSRCLSAFRELFAKSEYCIRYKRLLRDGAGPVPCRSRSNPDHQTFFLTCV